jgi:DNA-binding protein YbaB
MMKGQLAGLMKQAQAMQDNLKRPRTNWRISRSRASRAPAW